MAKKITPEIIGNIKMAANTEELIKVAKDLGVELTDDEAQKYYDKLHPNYSELSDDELDNVSGGCNGGQVSSQAVSQSVSQSGIQSGIQRTNRQQTLTMTKG
jgi:bacteriocin-like protein